MRNIIESDFTIETTPAGNVILRWRHNRRRIKLFAGYSRHGKPNRRAVKFRDWLIRYYKQTGFLIETEADRTTTEKGG